MTKLAPTYYHKLDIVLKPSGRYRELPSWRAEFKKAWRKVAETPITLPLNDRYRPNPVLWVCTCPAFAISRFLLCKHLAQLVHPVDPIFFLEVKRNRTTPFWSHPSLKPLDPLAFPAPHSTLPINSAGNTMLQFEDGDDGSENADDKFVDTADGTSNYRSAKDQLRERISQLQDFVNGLEYNVQFSDHRMVDALERAGATFFRFVDNCLDRERRENSTRLSSPTTYEMSTANAMFYRSRRSKREEISD